MTNIERLSKEFTDDERASLLKQFNASGLRYDEFANSLVSWSIADRRSEIFPFRFLKCKGLVQGLKEDQGRE